MPKTIEKMAGYKATDKNMQCLGIQFEIGKWYEVEGSPVICEHGFHFCPHPSGPWSYYSEEGTRVFKVEAEEVLVLPVDPGADHKCICRRIRLTEELVASGDGNTGNWNTGNRNTGDGNTGDWNTGHGNTGHGNTGDGNTGDGNTGHGNTGDGNTGDWNTGHGNTGDGNTGDGNTGDRSTGYGNAADFCSGFFCSVPQSVLCFDKAVEGLTREEFTGKYGYKIRELCSELSKDDPIDAYKYSDLPNWSEEAVKKLHETHKGRRKK